MLMLEVYGNDTTVDEMTNSYSQCVSQFVVPSTRFSDPPDLLERMDECKLQPLDTITHGKDKRAEINLTDIIAWSLDSWWEMQL
ncbi:hypothetical protein JCM33374_g1048 [Metschnikowia sp. JCM 33374]|nr:hypothetical protein JCM33374_g1048 [Metschnikowia sp. JCM 33374]